MSEDRDIVDQILEDLDIDRDGETSQEAENRGGEEDASKADRLERLREAGAITDEEYDILQSHFRRRMRKAEHPRQMRRSSDSPLSPARGQT